MDEPILGLMETNLKTVNLDDTIEQVETVMNNCQLTCIPVVDPNRKSFGVISAADLIRFHENGKNPKARVAWEICTHRLVEANMNISIREAAELMVKNKIHHIVVTDNRAVIGIVSSLDLINAWLLKPDR